MSLTSAFAEATIRTATPLVLAATGELLVERAGLINIGLEGVILGGAFGALVGATHGGTILGFTAAAATGVLVMLVFAAATLGMGADQIITGTAITLLSLGATGTLYRTLYGAGGPALPIAAGTTLPIPVLSRLPVIGTALFAQPAVTYFAYAVIPLTWWWFGRTHPGLALRAIGENPEAAIAAGVQVRRYRLGAMVIAGALGGIAGGVLVLAQAGTFVEGMSAGRGFIAIAIVVLGRWKPVGVGLAALLFAATTSLQYLAQAMGLDVPYQLVLALPYLLTLAALAGVGGRATPPATLARIQ
ncbi:MAG TPA: ABC transporter permease [Gemmatimonadaceae bacterium]|jgi:simple sugar transport system permease protein|nr:ABC transporter permease [Gemmatimonadaceae bacterium]